MRINYIHTLLLSLCFVNGYSQERAASKAEKKYDNYAYIDAIETYERIANKGYKNQEILQNLGNAYYFNAKLEESAKWYAELFEMTEDLDQEYFFRYAQSLKAIGNYEKADQMMAKFYQKNQSDSRGILANSQKDYLQEIKNNSGRYQIEDAGINSVYSDYGSSYYGDKLIFASARDTGSIAKRKHSWTGQSFTRLYASTIKEDGSLESPEKFANEINTRFHEATPVFTKDLKTVYFTRNNFNQGKKGTDSNKVTLLKIYRSTKTEDGKWGEAEELPFNSDEYQTAHPALSTDEKTLYFASDMPGTLGKSDLFKAAINPDGSFGTPVNLGATVNTEGRETFPFISGKNELYFSSDGHPGLGGLDIFVSQIKEDETLQEPVNIGEPANSSFDDFGYVINHQNKRGFLTSNRQNGVGNDDIYKFIENNELVLVCIQKLSGIVTNEETGEILPNAKLTLLDDKFNVLKETTSDAQGLYDFGEVDCNVRFYVRAEKQDYNARELSVVTPNENGATELPVTLQPTKKPIKIGDDLAKIYGITIIYFDLDKSNIRPDAAIELSKILDALNEYPSMKIDIRSHTDSRSSHKYNESLSDRRAKSTMAWLISKGIDKSRLTAKGYGETQLVNHCADGVKCSEEEHQLNRRSEFIVTDL